MGADDETTVSELLMQAFRDDPEFAKEYKESSGLVKKPTWDELLQLYALAKIAASEPLPEQKPAESQSSWNPYRKFAEKFDGLTNPKLAAWTKLAKENKTPEEARKEYIALVRKLKETYGFDESAVKPIKGL